MELKSMKMTEAEREKNAPTVASAPDQRQYPYGLCLSLDEATLKKLDLYGLPKVGETMMLMAQVKVESVSQHENGDGKDRSVSLQITDAALGRDGKQDRSEFLYDTGRGS